jgi:hypothetical protein
MRCYILCKKCAKFGVVCDRRMKNRHFYAECDIEYAVCYISLLVNPHIAQDFAQNLCFFCLAANLILMWWGMQNKLFLTNYGLQIMTCRL